ncbi:MAG: flagellar assembly protein FliW [Oscillospiraceae bacterium]|jgi:flagellar assembly factor FliW
MILPSARFGEIEIDDKKIISFPQGLPGLEEIKRFTLIRHNKTYPIYWLHAVDEPYISLPVIEPFLVLPDYNFNISDTDTAELSVSKRDDLYILNVVVIPEKIEDMTVNLAAPILINVRKNLGKQIVFDRKNYQIRYPAFESVCKYLKEVRSNAGAVEEN